VERRRLGRSDLVVSSIGLGAWSWGASQVWGYGKRYGRKEVEDAWWRSIEMGVNFVDTASVYGNGESERIIGDLLSRTEEPMVVATKYFPVHLLSSSVRGAAERSLRRLGLSQVDLYQVHWPNPLMSLRGTMREMERLVREGKVRYIGVSNFSVEQLEAARSYLSREDVVSNQIQYSLVHRKPERVGMMEHARREGVTVIAYSPIAMGLLTGNILRGARLKLNSVDLMGYFPVGGYGSDGEAREDLPAVAMRRAATNWGKTFPPTSVVVVGDTPRDVACARVHGSSCIAVATGTYPFDELKRTEADLVVHDLADTERIANWIRNL